MLDFFKKLLNNKSTREAAPVERPTASKSSSPPAADPDAAQAATRPIPQFRPSSNGDSIHISLQAILNGLPVELKARTRQSDVGDATICIPLDKILSQLSHGIVKIPYGEIRRVAAQVFSASKDCDQVQVVLPLDEVLAQIDPSMLVRRQDQRMIEVPEEISSPFGEHGQGLIFSVGPGKTPGSVSNRVVTPTPAAQSRQVLSRPVAPAKPQSSARVQPITPAKAPPPPAKVQPPPAKLPPIQAKPTPPAPPPAGKQPPAPAVPPPISKPMPPAPAKTPDGPPAIQPTTAIRSLGASLSTTTIQRRNQLTPQPPAALRPTPQAPAPPLPSPLRPIPQPPAQQRPTPPQQFAPQQFAPEAFNEPAEQEEPTFEAVPQPVTQPVPQPAKSEPVLLSVPLSTLCESWSEALRQEIAHMRIGDAKVALPLSTEEAIKRGKLAFPWKVVRSWIRPAQVPKPSPHDDTVVELPLKVIAPLFLARQKDGAKAQQKVAIDEEIPNLFFGFPQPESPAPAPETAAPSPKGSVPFQPPQSSKSVDTNYYVWDDSSDSAKVDESGTRRGAKTPGTAFVTRYATPNEVVSRAASLDGVSGALIALPDGLMVASKLSSDLNGDTLAAFLPHIFGKVSQCTKELRMGELNNLNFTVGNVPWKIFRVNAIYFAAFGRIGQPLPTAQLAALASELDHKKQ